MRIRDFMTPNPSVVLRNETIEHAAVLMRDRRVRVLPVIDDLCFKHLVGVITDRDIATRAIAAATPFTVTVNEVMTSRHLAVAHVDDRPSDVLKLMNDRQLRRVPVLDAREHVVGIVTMADLLKRHRSSLPFGNADFEWVDAVGAR